jgi:hypothetical protein
MTSSGRYHAGWWLAGLLVFAQQFSDVFADGLSGAAQFHKEVEPVLAEYCYDCHGGGEKKGGVAFDELKSNDDILANHDLWWNALNYLRAGLMPPGSKPRPNKEQQQIIANWIKTSVFKFNPENPDPGRVTLRRLNRVEYRNTIRDLMGVDYNTDVEFPADDTGYGFDDIGDVLTVPPMLLEKYVEAAKHIVAQAVPTDEKVISESVIAGSRFRAVGGAGPGNQRRQQGFGQGDTFRVLAYDKPATVGASFTAEHDGSYQLDMELSVKGPFEYDPHKCRIIFKMDDQELVKKEYGWYDNKAFHFQFDEKLAAGAHKLTFELQPVNDDEEVSNALSMRIDSVTIHGPMDRKYWTRPKNFDRFFTKDAPVRPEDQRIYASEILRNFASKAYRRPVDEKTVERLTALAETIYGRPGKTVEAGIAHAMEAVIASPRFLFLMEESAPGTSPADPWSQIDEYSLASRLSYFLWATMPDDELIRLAARGELRKNLTAQVKRMLDDARSEALVDNFTGQWLQARDVGSIAIDARAVLARDNGTEKQLREQKAAFAARQAAQAAQAALPKGTNGPDQPRPQRPDFRFAPNVNPRAALDQPTRDAMRRESAMFFSGIMHDDRCIDEFIECDYTFLNERLASFYGLTNLDVTGPEMRRVTLPPGSFRGGVLTEGTVLTVTSNPDRTSPVKRGVFVLNNILGTPPPPPPPNVPALEATENGATNHEMTMREAMEIHRNTPLCASCHARFDPIGLCLENFNAMGMWRDKERNQPIETGGKLITGEEFHDVRELKHILATKHREDFYRCLAQKLLTYALGRGLEYYDVGTVDQIVERLDEKGGHFSALLTGIIESAPFQKQRNRANPVFNDAADASTKGGAAQTAAKMTAK